uniref:Anaphase-promoting complex subunit 4-like WD40 domain-containing protein n=1 Tax=Corethron hystrix TaxID=216773 RepID=A0A7S1B8M8_9STRA|mmetsp:Transcript_17404/g.39301  ORF Transcript_17404/g.39301 Transcript_17404/m.39301 type:complete len:1412 (+) Transcript_17404:547-4782(+)
MPKKFMKVFKKLGSGNKSGMSPTGHEVLCDDDEKYLAKVSKRNSVKMERPSSKFTRKQSHKLRQHSLSNGNDTLLGTPVGGSAQSFRYDDVPLIGPAQVNRALADGNHRSVPLLPSPPERGAASDAEEETTGGIAVSPSAAWPVEDGRRGDALSRRRHRAAQAAGGGAPSGRISSPNSKQASVRTLEINRQFESNLPSGLISRSIVRRSTPTCVLWSYRGDILATAEQDGTVCLVDMGLLMDGSAHPGAVRQLPNDEGSPIQALSFGPDDTVLASAGDSGSIVVHDTRGLRRLAEAEREDRVYALHYSPAGDTLAVGGYDGLVALYSATDLSLLMEFVPEGGGLCLFLQFSPDASLLACTGGDGTVSLLDADGGDYEPLRTIGGLCRGMTTGLAWQCPGGDAIAVASTGGGAAVVDVETQTVVGYMLESEKNSSISAGRQVKCLCWSPDGTFIAVGTEAGTVYVFETVTFQSVLEITRPGPVRCLSWRHRGQNQGSSSSTTSSHNSQTSGGYLAIGTEGGKIDIVRTGTMGCPEDDSETVVTAGLSENGVSAISGGSASGTPGEGDEAVVVWSPKEFREVDESIESVHETDATTTYTNANSVHESKLVVNVVAFHPSGNYLAVGGTDCRLTMYERSIGWKEAGDSSTGPWTIAKEISNGRRIIHCATWSNAGKYLSLGNSDNSVSILLSSPPFTSVATVEAGSIANALGWNTTDSRLAIAGSDGVLTVYDSAGEDFSAWATFGVSRRSHRPLNSLDWSSDMRYLAIGGDGGQCVVYDAVAAESVLLVPLRTIARGSAVHAVKFTEDVKMLAVGGSDWTAAVYDVETWGLLHEVRMDGWVLTLGWGGRGGRFLALGGTDLARGGIVVDTKTWETVEPLKIGKSDPGIGIGYEVRVLNWTKGGKMLAVAGGGGAVRITDAASFKIVQVLAIRLPLDDKDNDGVWGGRKNIFGDQDVFSAAVPNSTSNPSAETSVEKKDEVNNFPAIQSADSHDILSDLASFDQASDDTSYTPPKQPKEAFVITKKKMRKKKNMIPSSGVTVQQVRDMWKRHTACFLEATDVLLETYRENKRSSRIDIFVDAIRMLKMHVKWINLVDSGFNNKIWAENRIPYSICFLLAGAKEIIDEILDDSKSIGMWWSTVKKFATTDTVIRDYEKWNARWSKYDPDSILLDVDLLVNVDRVTMEESKLDISQDFNLGKITSVKVPELEEPTKTMQNKVTVADTAEDTNRVAHDESPPEAVRSAPASHSYEHEKIPDIVSSASSTDQQGIPSQQIRSQALLTKKSSEADSDFYGIITGRPYEITSFDEGGLPSFENGGAFNQNSSNMFTNPENLGSNKGEGQEQTRLHKGEVKFENAGDTNQVMDVVDVLHYPVRGQGMIRKKSRKFESDSEDDASVAQESPNYDDNQNYWSE